MQRTAELSCWLACWLACLLLACLLAFLPAWLLLRPGKPEAAAPPNPLPPYTSLYAWALTGTGAPFSPVKNAHLTHSSFSRETTCLRVSFPHCKSVLAAGSYMLCGQLILFYFHWITPKNKQTPRIMQKWRQLPICRIWLQAAGSLGGLKGPLWDTRFPCLLCAIAVSTFPLRPH